MSKKANIQALLDKKSSNESDSRKNAVIQEYINPEIHQSINTEIQETAKRKKATFQLDPDLHKRLKIFSINEGKNMVEVVEEALREFMSKNEK